MVWAALLGAARLQRQRTGQALPAAPAPVDGGPMGFFSRCVKSKKKAAAYEKAEAAKRAKDGPEGTVVKAPRRLLPRCTKRRFGGEFWDLLVFGLFAVLFGNYLYGSLSGHKFYISLYLDNALTQGEWYPKKTFMTTLDTNEWSQWLRGV